MKPAILLIAAVMLLAACDTMDTGTDPEQIVCPTVYDPVCGDDGITYGNTCVADIAGVSYTPGECASERLPDEQIVCIGVYDPVCGDDGKTYANACYAEVAGVSYAQGACIELRACPAIYAPVCGQPPMPECPEGMACAQVMPPLQTYSNECVMDAAGASLVYRGECVEPQEFFGYTCTPEQKTAQACTREYMPVCGDDGITYGNKCEACAAQVDTYVPGECA